MGESLRTTIHVREVRNLAENLVVHDDEVIVLANEFDQVRQCLGMYIGVGETEGVMHLANEVMTNCIDEAVNPEVIHAGYGDVIKFYFDEADCRFTIWDNGRGMPLDKMMDLVGKKHAGTKFRSITSANRYSGGQNGVGITVTAALADSFQVTCWRGGQTRSLHMEGNELVDDGYEKCDAEKHGTRITFVPSRHWIGEFHIELADVEDYLRRLSYILPERVRIKYYGENGKDKHTMTYKAQGLAANVEFLDPDLSFQPIWLKVPEIVIEHEGEDREPDYFKMEFAFSYGKNMAPMLGASFCNYIATKDGGYHEAAVTKCIADFFTKQAKTLDPQHKYEVTQDDCRTGLVFVVNCDHSNPNFEGQHKSRVGAKDIVKYSRKPIMDALTAFFETNNALLRRICGYLHQVAKARLEISNVKKNTMKKASSFLDDAEMKIFTNISDRNRTGYKELILAEGDSAIAAIGSARNVKCQAIIAITGVIPNVFNMTEAEVMKHPTLSTLVKVIGAGIGESFDITKCKWSVVEIATDKDVDGDYITALLCLFFLKFMLPLVTSGRLYKIIPPLYLIDTKPIKNFYTGRNYLFDKGEYYQLFHKLIAQNMEMAVVEPHTMSEMIKGKGAVTELTERQKMDLLNANLEYHQALDDLVHDSACLRDVLEYVIYFYVVTRMAPDPDEKFQTMITKKFPELHYDAELQSIYGSYDYKSITLIIDRIFFNMAKRMIKCVAESPTFYLLCRSIKRNRGDDPHGDNWQLMTYGEFMAMCHDAFDVPILQRYKGLGETETIMVFPSLMNPKTRKLVRITVSDVAKTMEQLRHLHGDTPDMRESRRQMLADADITMADIDN